MMETYSPHKSINAQQKTHMIQSKQGVINNWNHYKELFNTF